MASGKRMAETTTAAVPPPEGPVSMRGLALAVGRSLTSVRRWTSRRDWPFGKGPCNVMEVREWMKIHLKRDPAQRYHDAQKGIGAEPLSQVDRARAMSFAESALIRRLKREQLQGTLHNVEECRTRRRRQILAVRNALTRTLPRALAAELIGRARGDMEHVIRTRLLAVCELFAAED